MNRTMRIDAGHAGQGNAMDIGTQRAAHRHLVMAQRDGQFERYAPFRMGGRFRPMERHPIRQAAHAAADTDIVDGRFSGRMLRVYAGPRRMTIGPIATDATAPQAGQRVDRPTTALPGRLSRVMPLASKVALTWSR